MFLKLNESKIDKQTNKDEAKYKNIMEDFVIRNDNVKDMNLLINIFGPHVIESSLIDKFWQINFSYLDKPDKTNDINSRLEIRYMGGENYPEKEELISSNLLHILNCVKIAMNNDIKDNELYFKFIGKIDVDRFFNELEDFEIKLLKIIFKKDNLLDLEIEFNKTKQEIDLIKQRYGNGIKK